MSDGKPASTFPDISFAYGETHASCLTGAAGPHAVSSVAGTKNATYCYDATEIGCSRFRH